MHNTDKKRKKLKFNKYTIASDLPEPKNSSFKHGCPTYVSGMIRKTLTLTPT